MLGNMLNDLAEAIRRWTGKKRHRATLLEVILPILGPTSKLLLTPVTAIVPNLRYSWILPTFCTPPIIVIPLPGVRFIDFTLLSFGGFPKSFFRLRRRPETLHGFHPFSHHFDPTLHTCRLEAEDRHHESLA